MQSETYWFTDFLRIGRKMEGMLPKLLKVRVAFQATQARLSCSSSIEGATMGTCTPLSPLPRACIAVYASAALLILQKMRHAGDAPAPSRWQRDVLLVDECRDYRAVKKIPVAGLAPALIGS